ncbi:MBL fold metallo-hydrolase [Halobacteriaceae archaeon GCM10025711]
MPSIRRLPVPVATRAPTGETTAHLVGREDALLVDPAGRTDALDDAVASRDVAHVAVTHTHRDHVGGISHYARTTGATVWARAGYEDRFERATGVTPDRTFREGTTVTVAGAPVTVLATPGHAPDHVAFAAGGDVLVGDLAVAEGSVFVGATEGDMRAYLTALRRLHARDPDRLLPAHGPTIDHPRERLAALVAHRLDRERRVRDAVHAGARTVDEVVDAAYDKDLTGVRDLAADTVAAHLAKLAVEGRVAWDGDRAGPA